MSFLNAKAKQVFCKLAVHGEGAPGFVEALTSMLGLSGAATGDPGFRVVDFVVSGYEIGPYALRLCVYALDGSDDVHALLAGADAITVILGGTAADRTVADIAPYVNERVPVVLACPPGRDAGEVAYPVIAIDPAAVDGARVVVRALVPQIVAVARAKWIK